MYELFPKYFAQLNSSRGRERAQTPSAFVPSPRALSLSRLFALEPRRRCATEMRPACATTTPRCRLGWHHDTHGEGGGQDKLQNIIHSCSRAWYQTHVHVVIYTVIQSERAHSLHSKSQSRTQAPSPPHCVYIHIMMFLRSHDS